MKPLSLHIKTALLTSTIVLFVIAATVALFGSRVVGQLQDGQKQVADLEAASLAENINNLGFPRDYGQIASSVEMLRQSRPNRDDEDQLRIWERKDGAFIKRVANPNDAYPEKLTEEAKTVLRNGLGVKAEEADGSGTVYRVFIPFFEGERVSGAVEAIEKIDTTWTLLANYLWSEMWLALASVTFLSVSIYGLFQFLVYRPLEEISRTITKAKNGALDARVNLRSENEIGALGQEFNRMLAEIGEMTAERERRQEILRERVKDATCELQTRNEQLEGANLQIWQTTRKLAELERLASAGQTAAQFAHEVGTPLNLISGHVQLLRLNLNGNETAQNRLEIITAQIERIEKIVRSMLDRTRFNDEGFAEIHLNSVLENISRIVLPTLEAKNIRLSENFESNLPPIRGNSEHLQQVFLNLINNAIDAMPKGGELKIALSGGQNKLCVKISDSGIGMNAETKGRIFEPLFTTKQRGQGTGLGLVVVREILQEHAGEIEVETAPGNGTTFKISFPQIGEQTEIPADDK
jgi:signal transduction histidine kinase